MLKQSFLHTCMVIPIFNLVCVHLKAIVENDLEYVLIAIFLVILVLKSNVSGRSTELSSGLIRPDQAVFEF